jgi:hypothetical protein
MIDNPIFADSVRVLDSNFGITTHPEAKVWVWSVNKVGGASLEICGSGANAGTLVLLNLDKTQVRALVAALTATL